MNRVISPRSRAVSVSIVVYETPAEELCRLLAGLRRNRLRAAITVVDNSPTEALRSVAEDAGAEYVSPRRNLGYGAGNNLAMREAVECSKYHLVCNPDIVSGPGVLDELFDCMERNPDLGLVMPKMLYPDGREQRLCKLLPTPADLLVRRFLGNLGARLMRERWDRYEMRGVDLEVSREVPSLSGCFMFLRSSVLREVGLFDPRYFMYMEDVDLCRRVGAVSRTVFLPSVSVEHGYAKGSYRSRKLLGYHLRSAVRYFNKWGWFRDRERSRMNERTAVWAAGGEYSLEHAYAGDSPAARTLR